MIILIYYALILNPIIYAWYVKPLSLIVQWFLLCKRCNTWGQMNYNGWKNIMKNSCVDDVAQANLWSSAQKFLYPCIKEDENWKLLTSKTRTARSHSPTKRPSLIEELCHRLQNCNISLVGAGYVNRYIRRRRGYPVKRKKNWQQQS
jgi:hypothetical protein